MSEKKRRSQRTIDENETFSRVKIRGKVVRKIRTKQLLIFAVASVNSNSKKIDYPRFVAFENLSELDKSFSIGDRITVVARVRTSKRYPEGTLIPESVTIEKSRLEAALKGEDYQNDMNEIVIRGVIAGEPYSPNNNVTLTSIIVEEPDGRKNFIHTVSFGKTAEIMRRKHANETIETLGYIRTKTTAETKDVKKNQSIVITVIG